MSYADSGGSGRAVAILGDHWNLAVLRLALLGVDRFSDWQRELAISASVLSQRLQTLVAEGLLEVEAGDGRPSPVYHLTGAGRAAWKTLVALWLWDERWAHDRSAAFGYRLRHDACGQQCRPLVTCPVCGALDVTARDTRVEVRSRRFNEPDVDAAPTPRYRRPSRSIASAAAAEGGLAAADLLSDRWSALVISAAFLGSRRFSEFEAMLEPVPTPTLSNRLAGFVTAGVMERTPADGGGYRLTVKGRDFFPVLVSMIDWAHEWTSSGSATVVFHRACDERLRLAYTCNQCRGDLGLEGLTFENRPAGAAGSAPPDTVTETGAAVGRQVGPHPATSDEASTKETAWQR